MSTYRSMQRLPLSEIRPEGWLKRQLQIQMDGLSGRLYDIWDSVGSYSGWLGGTGENWERAPYYLDGLLPLAYYLEDEKRLALCERFVQWTLGSKQADGNFGPRATQTDYWSRFAMLKVLLQHFEITGDDRVLPLMRDYFSYVADAVKVRPPESWSKARIPDLLYCMKWAYEQTGDARIVEQAQALDRLSYDWGEYLRAFPFPRPTRDYVSWERVRRMSQEEYDKIFPYHATHIVNVAMGIKHPAMRYAFWETEEAARVTRSGLAEIDLHHGVASGCVNGDEHLAGNSPNQGSELCAVVESMFSLAAMLEVFAQPYLADRIERLAYNALPATISEDFMSHQYLQQANQVLVTDEERPWFNNGSDASVFGLEPNFGCCTANMHQGWPKLVNALWFKQSEDTLLSMVLAPCAVRTRLGGHPVEIALETEYPFRETLTYRILEASPEPMTLKLRVPAWCQAPLLNGEAARPRDGMLQLRRVFQAGETVRLSLPMEASRSRWYRDSVAVERGPLVYGLNIRERWEPYREAGGVKDYCIYPQSPWNYALSGGAPIAATEEALSQTPFSKEHPPVRLRVKAKRLEGWMLQGGNADEPPQSPVACDAEEEDVELIPFGCTKLRISQFPCYVGEKD